MIQDAQGHRLSGATAAAAAAYDQAVRAFNLVHGDAVGLFDRRARPRPTSRWPHLGKAWVFAIANDPGLMTQAAALVETAPALDVERARASPSRRAVPFGAGRPGRRRRGAGPPPDALPVRPRRASGRGIDRRVSRALPLGPRPLGAGPAILVQGQPGYGTLLALHALRAGGGRRLRARRGRVARSRRTRAVELLAASHRRACDGNDRAPGRRARVDGGARGAVVDPRAYEPGAYLVAQGAVPSRARAIRRGARAL